jgi:hypothetical protein
MKRDQIDEIIREIMINDGPDGHIDGHETIADFIVALLEGRGEAWAASYVPKRELLGREVAELEGSVAEEFGIRGPF